MNIIRIRGVEFSACHGLNNFEKVEKQPFIFDADVTADFYGAAKNDELLQTVNYSSFCKMLERVTLGNTFNLIEKLAYECAFTAFEEFPQISALSLTVWKPQAPMKRKFESVGATVEMRREKVYLSLGSSMGDKKKYLDTALEKLSATRGVKVEKVSEYVSTEPYGGAAENMFLNCAACVSTVLTPHALLDEIHRIEAECGRVRDKRWGDRTLDIDIIFFGNENINDERLTVPHRDFMNRDFVKIPLKSIAPHLNF